MRFLVWIALALATAASSSLAQVAPEKTGGIEKLPQPFRPHWIWVTDVMLERAALVDLDTSRFLGVVPGGYGVFVPLFPKRRPEVYIPSTYYSRRTHGERTDVVEIYDLATLGHAGEVVVPPKRATNAVAVGHSALSDDDRFLALFNWTTGTGLSIVDMEQRHFVGEIEMPGCSLVYAGGPRTFFSICGDGSLFVVKVKDDGTEAIHSRGKPFFAPATDPITEKAVRVGKQWLFVSFEGLIYPIDASGAEPVIGQKWSLVDDADRKESWRIGGLQHLAAHVASGKLYALMHQGGVDTHKEAGTEVWVFDIATHQRVERIKLVFPGATLYGFPIEVGKDWPWPFDGMFDWALDHLVPPSVTAIGVTQDDQPLLISVSQFTGAVAVHDARTGQFLRRVLPVGWNSSTVVAPWDGKG